VTPTPLSLARPSVAAGDLEGPLRTLWRHKEKIILGLDVLTVSSAFMVSFYLRFHSGWFTLPPVDHTAQYVKGAVLLTAIWVFLIWRREGYTSGFRGMGAPMLRIRSLVTSAVGAISVLMVISFLYRDLLLSRQVYLTTTVFALAIMILTRILMRSIEADLAAQIKGAKRILLLGDGQPAREFVRRLEEDFPFYELVRPAEENAGHGVADLRTAWPASTPIATIRALHDRRPFDKIVLSLGEMQRSLGPERKLTRLIEILNDCEARGVTLYALPDSFNVVVHQSEVASLSGMPLLRLRDAARHPAHAVVKRVADLLVSLGVLLGGMPLWASIALLIKGTSRGPVFHTQWRVGLHGRLFRIYKFRSMRVDAEDEFERLADVNHLEVPGVKIDHDRRVTPVGRWLRRTSLDEIPQLINVLKGEMTLVGPRPELPCLVERYSAFERRRLKGRPGITGFQQVMARNEPLAGAMKYDLTYLKEQGLLFDLYILARTLPVMWKGR
jgi:exopolysaccharide biosynthesis polyprenyl glycosylphosphotransferase